jgi:hypothetical protein
VKFTQGKHSLPERGEPGYLFSTAALLLALA